VKRDAGAQPARKAQKTTPIASNRKAFHDYFIEDRAEAGLVLTGTEVKSLREGRAQLKDSFVHFRDGEAYLVGAHISPYGSGSWTNHAPERDRKLLLHRREIGQLGKKVAERGMTLVPLALYFSDGRVKVELGLAKGKEGIDKRRSIADRDARRQMERAMRERERGPAR
jgi:SsrA-binding protein